MGPSGHGEDPGAGGLRPGAGPRPGGGPAGPPAARDDGVRRAGQAAADVAPALEAPGAPAVGRLLPEVALLRLAGRRPAARPADPGPPARGARGRGCSPCSRGGHPGRARAAGVVQRPSRARGGKGNSPPWLDLVGSLLPFDPDVPSAPAREVDAPSTTASRGGPLRSGSPDPDGARHRRRPARPGGGARARAPAAVEALALAEEPLVVGAVAGQLYELARLRADAPWNGARWFDVAVLDEASQLPVADAATLLCALREGARLVVAGDVRQLGPVRRVPPVEPIRSGLPGLPGLPPDRRVARRSRRREPPRNPARRPPTASSATCSRRTGSSRSSWCATTARTRRSPLASGGASTAAGTSPTRPSAGCAWRPRSRATPRPRRGGRPACPGRPVGDGARPGPARGGADVPARQHALSNAFEAQVAAALALLLRRHLPRRAPMPATRAARTPPTARRRRSGASGPSRWRSSPPTAPSGR